MSGAGEEPWVAAAAAAAYQPLPTHTLLVKTIRVPCSCQSAPTSPALPGQIFVCELLSPDCGRNTLWHRNSARSTTSACPLYAGLLGHARREWRGWRAAPLLRRQPWPPARPASATCTPRADCARRRLPCLTPAARNGRRCAGEKPAHLLPVCPDSDQGLEMRLFRLSSPDRERTSRFKREVRAT